MSPMMQGMLWKGRRQQENLDTESKGYVISQAIHAVLGTQADHVVPHSNAKELNKKLRKHKGSNKRSRIK